MGTIASPFLTLDLILLYAAIKRIVSSNSQKNKFQVAYIAMNKEGDVGSYSVEPGFTYMDYFNGENKEKITDSAY